MVNSTTSNGTPVTHKVKLLIPSGNYNITSLAHAINVKLCTVLDLTNLNNIDANVTIDTLTNTFTILPHNT